MSNQPWPNDVSELVDKFSRDTGTTVTMREPLLQGKSGAFVAIVECKGSHDGVYVLKVTPVSKEYADEESRHRQAIDIGAFSKSVPPLVGHTKDDCNHLLLMCLAGRSRSDWRPLVESLKLFGSAYVKLVQTLWTVAQFEWINGVSPSLEIIRALGYRLKHEDGGRILSNVSMHLLPALLTSVQFTYRRQVLPNPLHFVTKADVHHEPPATMLRGPIHGDCHSGNVFVKANMEAQVAAISLIDLGCFQADSMIFFDHAYLELATLLHQLENIGEERWGALVAALADETKLDTLEQLERGWAQDICRGRTELFRLAFDTWPDRQDDLKIQFHSAQVAAGLAFLNKVFRKAVDGPGLSKAQYQQAFVWAAFNLRRLLGLLQITMPASVDSIPALSATDPEAFTAKGLTDEQWRAVDGFDNAGLNVLVLSPSTRQVHLDAVAKLMRLDWGLVIDFGTTPIDDSLLKACRRTARQHWPGPSTDVRLINRGTLWYFANGRQDLSDAEPSKTTRDWRRNYGEALRKLLSAIKEHLYPSSVRALVLHDDVDGDILLRTCENLDTDFAHALRPIFLATSAADVNLGDVDATKTSLSAVLDKLAAMAGPIEALSSVAVLPRRSEGVIRLEAAPPALISRVERDLVVVGLHRASHIPAGRVFGIDFRRGMVVEWPELAHRLDVTRELFTEHRRELEDLLAASKNATVNLLHEPSAGGSTLSRRLAWSFIDRYPVVLVERVSNETAGHLRDIFQHCALPVLVVMEAEVVTDSEREVLLRQLREDNTRSVFLWVRRSYAKSSKSNVLSSRLSDSEAHKFLNVYLEQVASNEERQSALRKLAASAQLVEQRSPFFFGLTAFGENYLGLERLITDVLDPMSAQQRSLMAQLALVSAYTSEGMPVEEFDQMCRAVDLDRQALEARSSFLVTSMRHVRIPHVLIAQRALQHLARNTQEWKADLRIHAIDLIDEVRKLKLQKSSRIRGMVETLFVTRDLVTALESDADAQIGSLSRQRRFSPLIEDLGSVEIAREILNRVVNVWPDEPHFSVHYARHLLYEEPKDIESAITVASQASQMPSGSKDHSVIHMVGMCYRVKMEQRFSLAHENRQPFDSIAKEVEADFREAVSRFAAAIELQPASEYGHVATIQTIRTLLDRAMKVAQQDLPNLLSVPDRRWLMDALALAEDHIEQIGQMPRYKPSLRAQRTIGEWQLVYGKVDQVIAKLRSLANRYEDTDVRRALCRAIVVKHDRQWAKIPQSDLHTIKTLTERNIESQGVRDSDVRIWLRTVRNMSGFDIETVLRTLADWHQLRPTAVEPTFYLYCFYLVWWLNSNRTSPGLARESNAWLDKTRANRGVGERSWSYEWLGTRDSRYRLVNHADLTFDPISLIRDHTSEKRKILDSHLTRVEGTIREYKGPTQAKLDLGQGVMLRFTPQTRIVSDDEGKRASAFVSFAYDGLIGWDVRLSSGG